MMSAEDNELLTRVGPGTPMGRLMRAYWMPALLSRELAPDSPPLRVMLLGERLIAFRDSDGRVALVAEECPHRGASLAFARNEQCGLRCAYHGWKFDVTGACVDVPTEPADSPLKRKVRLRSYPCVERGGLVWTYLGGRAPAPPLPELVPNLEESAGAVGATMLECNWLQIIEGDVDIAHIPYLHASNNQTFDAMLAQAERPPEPPTMHVEDTPAGFAFAAAQTVSPTAVKWRVGQFMFPCFATLPYGELGAHWVVARVPMDDTHTMTFGMFHKEARVPGPRLMLGPPPFMVPNTADWFGRFRLARNPTNDFGRDLERGRGPDAIAGQVVQDAAITWSMGPIADRTKEHLGPSDAAIIRLRARLLKAVRRFEEDGAPALATPEVYRVMNGAFELSPGAPWFEELLRAQASIARQSG